MAFAEMEPFGPLYDDLRAGKIAAAAHNAAMGFRKLVGSKQPWKASDFFSSLEPDAPPPVQSDEDQVAAVGAVMRGLGGRFTPGGSEA